MAIDFDTTDNRLLIVESFSPILTPRNYRSKFGQLLEHSPFCERDIRAPHELETHDELGDFVIKIKKENKIHEKPVQKIHRLNCSEKSNCCRKCKSSLSD